MDRVQWKQHLRSLFFKFMLTDGYLSGKKPQENKYLLGHKSFTGTYDNITIIDEWTFGPNLTKTYGRTIILEDGLPIWVMTYEGFYQDEDLELLQFALLTQYQKEVFYGGRGAKVTIGIKEYTNSSLGNFDKFEGTEAIIDTVNGYSLGTHSYRGGFVTSV